MTASAIIASIGDGHQFSNGREFAAWLGLTPANKSSGGKEKLGRITTLSGHCVVLQARPWRDAIPCPVAGQHMHSMCERGQ
nr:transposase [Octadecabacter antarcticus]